MGRCEIGSMGDYVRLDPERAGSELARAERKLAEIRAIAANTHIGGMSVPMSKRLIAIIDGMS